MYLCLQTHLLVHIYHVFLQYVFVDQFCYSNVITSLVSSFISNLALLKRHHVKAAYITARAADET